MTDAASAVPLWLRYAPRVVLAGCLGALVAGYIGIDRIAQGASFQFTFDLTSTAVGTAQLFYDRGGGFNEADSSTAAIDAWSTPTRVALNIPLGRYRALRLDPSNGPGDFTITNPRIEDAAGRVAYQLDPASVAPAGGTLLTYNNSALVIAAPANVTDPQLVLTPPAPIELRVATQSLLTSGAAFVGTFLVSFLLLALVERGTSSTHATITDRAATPSTAAVVIAATIAAVVATYPLLLGKSLVAPANGGVVMLYDNPPYVPGGSDYVTEDTRGSDTGALMWGLLPYSKLQREAVAEGEWPLWERYNGLGRPLWGSGLSTFLDPLHLLSLLIDDPAVGWDLKFFYARIVFAVGIGMVALRATGSPWAAALVACAAPFFGYFAYRFNHPAYFSITYAPWLLWALLGIANAASRRSISRWAAAVSVLIVLQLVASTPKEGSMVFIIAFGAGALTTLLSSGPLWLWRVGGVAASGVIGLLLAAPHWLVFLDTLSRAWTIYDVARVRFGSWPLIRGLFLGANLPGMPIPSVNSMIGAGLVLAIVAAARLWRSPAAVACAIMAGVAMAIALGVMPEAILLKVPLVRNVTHIDYTFTAAAILPLTVVAAFGFREAAHVLSRPFSAAMCVVLCAGLAVAVLRATDADFIGLATAIPIWAAMAAGGLIPITAAAVQMRASRWLALPALVCIAAIVLLPAGLHLDTGIPIVDRFLLQPRNRANLIAESPATEAAKAISTEPFRALGVGLTLFPGTQGLWELEGLIGADALELPYFRELGTPVGMFNHPWGWVSFFSVEDMQRLAPLLDMFGVRAVFAHPETPIGFGRVVPLKGRDALKLIERPSAWPRAFFTTSVERYATPEQFLAQLNQHAAPFASTQSSDADSEALVASLPRTSTPAVAATRYHLTTNSTSFTVTAPDPGVAVLAEAYVSRDFQAFLNGEPAPYFRVDHMYKGVVIPRAGEWTVRFEYRPQFWGRAWVMTTIGAVLMVSALWLSRKPSLL